VSDVTRSWNERQLSLRGVVDAARMTSFSSQLRRPFTVAVAHSPLSSQLPKSLGVAPGIFVLAVQKLRGSGWPRDPPPPTTTLTKSLDWICAITTSAIGHGLLSPIIQDSYHLLYRAPCIGRRGEERTQDAPPAAATESLYIRRITGSPDKLAGRLILLSATCIQNTQEIVGITVDLYSQNAVRHTQALTAINCPIA